jgi:hypothetical protein
MKSDGANILSRRAVKNFTRGRGMLYSTSKPPEDSQRQDKIFEITTWHLCICTVAPHFPFCLLSKSFCHRHVTHIPFQT